MPSLPQPVISCKLLKSLFKHIETIMVLVDNEHRGWVDCSSTTKCLNTGVILCTMLMSSDPIFKVCENNAVINRAQQNTGHNKTKAAQLKRLLLQPSSESQLVYVIMTDGEFSACPKQVNNFYPGHVFVIEKLPLNAGFIVFQTFVDRYDTSDLRSCKRLTMKQMTHFLDMLQDLYGDHEPYWTPKMQQVFRGFTGLSIDYPNWTHCLHDTSLDFRYRSASKDDVRKRLTTVINRWHRKVQLSQNNEWKCGDAFAKSKVDLLKDLESLQKVINAYIGGPN